MTRATELFERNGALATALPGYELRQEQIRMAAAVERCIDRGGVLLAEAGTGTGKTLAYLTPAILSGRRVVISTGTKNLQDQIYLKDIAFLGQALGHEPRAAYLKGQDNYLCQRRFDEFTRSPAVLAYPAERVAEIDRWSRGTTTGDRMEIVGLPDDDPIWREICSTNETRIGQRCAYFEHCYVSRARQAAQRARLIVVNHHLYFADLATRQRGGAILPEHDAVIFDEAHLIEDVATEFFSIKVGSGRVDRLMKDVVATVRAAKLIDDPHEDRRPDLADASRSLAVALFSSFRGPAGKVPLVVADLDESKHRTYHRLDAALEAVEQSVRALEGRDLAVDHCAERCAALRDDLATILDTSRPGHVHWCETKTRSVVLGVSPIDVSDVLREGIFFAVPAVTLTSATLSTSGEFAFVRARLGIDFEAEELSLPAPFDFTRQACLFVPEGICDPRDTDFPKQAALATAELARITSGGALVLCTSLRNMKAIHSLLADRVLGPLLIQGSAPKTTLLERFTADTSSILVATTSFWQGVDLPGEALRLVIIDKLPFASPGDPIVAARIELLANQGGNPFTEYQVPQAALTLKQGFGRLIRTQRDRGIVAILDRRLRTMPYAKTFYDSLPACPRLQDLKETEEWWLNSGSTPREIASPAD